MPNPRRASLGAIFLTVFLDLLGFGLVLPFLAKEARATFGISEFAGTLLGSSYSLMQFFFVPVWGRISDRIGRRPVLVWSVLATSLSMAALGTGLSLGTSLLWLYAARIFGGIATANLGVASAYIADITKPEERTKSMGLIGAAFGLGFILGPAIGGALSRIAVNGHYGAVPCFVAAGLSLVNFAWVLFGVGESLPKDRRTQTTTRSLSPLNFDAVRRARALPGVSTAMVVNFLVVLAFTNLDQTFTFFCTDAFSFTNTQTGGLLAGVGLVAALVQGALIRPLSKRVSDAAFLRSGALIQAIAFALIVASTRIGLGMLLFAMGLLAVGNGFTQPATSGFVSKHTPPDEQGKILSVNQSFASLARTFGPALGGLLYTYRGMVWPYVAGATGMAVAWVAALRLPRK
jgi:MFS family permease